MSLSLQFLNTGKALLEIGSAFVEAASKTKTGKVIEDIFQGKAPSQALTDSAVQEISKAVSVLKKEASFLGFHLKTADVSTKELCEMALQQAPNLEAYYQILAQQASQCKWPADHKLPQSEAFSCPQFQVKECFDFDVGISGIVVTPVNENSLINPLIIFRGTDSSNINNLIDDIHPEVGELNCKKCKNELKFLIEMTHVTSGKRVHLLGHSYGSAVAQRLTSEYPELVARCTSHGGIRVGEKAAAQFKSKAEELTKKGITPPQVHIYRHAKDVVPHLGTGEIPATPGYDFTVGSVQDKCSVLEAHGLNGLSIPNIPIVVDATPNKTVVETAKVLEQSRKGASHSIPLLQTIADFFKKNELEV